MTQNFNNEVMDERVARLNEFKSVKMSSISRGKRPAAKFNKEVATYLLNNWSNIDQLKLCVDAMRKDMPEACKEVMDIYDKRVKELAADKVELKFHEGDWVVNRFGDVWHIDSFDSKNYQVSNRKGNYNYYNYFPILEQDEMRLWTIQDAKDGDVLAVTMYPEGIWIGIFKEQNGCTFSSHCFVNTDGIFKKGTYNHGNGRAIHPATKEQRDTLFAKMKEAGYEWDAEKKELKKAERKAEVSVKKSANKRKTGASKTRKVGDRHPNGLWIWTEYKEGKFDWRIDPAIKRKPGRKGGVTTNQSKKKEVAGKAEKAKPAAASKLTLEELLTKPTPQGLSKSQKAVIKFIKRGYRLRKDGGNFWLTDSHGNNERVEKSVLEALQRKYKIDYVPEGLQYNK